MVAIFTGLGSGMERSSVSALGAQGLLGGASLGVAGEQVFLNATTGNLMINRLDEFLVGVGPDASVSRTYNSMVDPLAADGSGIASRDDNDDQWRQSTDRRVYGLTGVYNTAGSSVKRMSADGSEITYTWSGSRNRYVTFDGEGAYDTLSYYSGVWAWEDGQTGLREEYCYVGTSSDYCRIVTQTDRENNSVRFEYDTNRMLLTKVTTQNGEYIQYTWHSTQSRITNVTVGKVSPGGVNLVARSTTYAYDSNRLRSVTVDLSPADTTDSNVFTTTYSYDGSSDRVTMISGSDGSQLAIEYTLKPNTTTIYRVTKLTQKVDATQSRVTTIGYTLKADGATETKITDPSANQIIVTSDVNGNLTQLDLSASSNAPATTIRITYTEDGRGNVKTIEDELGNHTDYDYTSQGLVRTETDRMGNATSSAYNSANQLIARSQWSANGGIEARHTTYYVYDQANAWRLRYTIDASGNVESVTMRSVSSTR